VILDRVAVDVDDTRVLTDVDLEIADGAFVGVVGPSGSGKTTLLRAIAGLTPLRRGRIVFDDVDITTTRPEDRDVGMVFQKPALLPNRSVGRNVAFPLEIRHQHVEEIRRRVGAETRAMHLEHLLMRSPSELSRGEEHLVQIARTMVRVPRVLLLDEPFANLDAPLRDRIRHEIGMLQDGYGVTTLMTTNDPHDALTLPSVLAVVDGGRVVQYAPPHTVRSSPATLGAAVATGEMSIVRAVVRASQGAFELVAAADDGAELRWHVRSPAYADRVGEEVIVATRAEHVHRRADGAVSATLHRRLAGSPPMLACRIGRDSVFAHGEADDDELGSLVRLHLEHATVFDATTGHAID
jgi:ABC-type sugar transport system ATPase subunit